MATGDITFTNIAEGTFTITLASLVDTAARQATLIDNSSTDYPAALVSVKLTTGTTPTADTVFEVYLIRDVGTIIDDAGGASDAAITIVNAPLLGTVRVPAATSDTAYYGIFDTWPLGALGPGWGIAVANQTGATMNATGGNHLAHYAHYHPNVSA